LTAYKAILDFIPKLKKLLPIQDDSDPDYFYGVVNSVRTSAHTPLDALTNDTFLQMQIGCSMARSEAIRRVKDNLVRYLASGRRPVNVDPHWHTKDKVLRGLNDPEIGRLLIPAEDLLDWDADPHAYVYRLSL
jgi:hypothetical protein